MGDDTRNERRRAAGLVGWSTYGSFLVGVGGVLAALAAIWDKEDFSGAGLCLVASALGFGLLLNGFLRS